MVFFWFFFLQVFSASFLNYLYMNCQNRNIIMIELFIFFKKYILLLLQKCKYFVVWMPIEKKEIIFAFLQRYAKHAHLTFYIK